MLVQPDWQQFLFCIVSSWDIKKTVNGEAVPTIYAYTIIGFGDRAQSLSAIELITLFKKIAQITAGKAEISENKTKDVTLWTMPLINAR